MAPERPGHNSIAGTANNKGQRIPVKPSTILDDFLEIKIKEELNIKPEPLYEQVVYRGTNGATSTQDQPVQYEQIVIRGSGGKKDICAPVYREVVLRGYARPEEPLDAQDVYEEVPVVFRGRRREEDQDLTSLSWLQSNNLLKSKPLKLPETAVKKETHEESPTSDLAEETGSESSTSHSQGSSRESPPALLMDGPSVSMVEETRTTTARQYSAKDKHHYSVPYDPQLHINSKPPYSFSCLIFMAIEDSNARALPVKEIYSWITDHFPYFNKAPTGWKNSVRHNLSLNKCFRKVDKAPNLGKGSLWIVDPQYRPNLLNALSKAPYHPCASLDRPPKPPILPPASLTPQQQDFIAVKTQSRLPNPELFPFLSKRLAASEADRMNETYETDEDSLDDVDAATAMLELKHGQTRPTSSRQWRKKPRLGEDNVKLLISTSPSEDHTYSVDAVTVYKLRHSVSPDTAYGGGSDSTASPFVDENEESWSSDGAEQRNVASALLHLAGGSRKRSSATSHESPSYKSPTPRGKKSNQQRPSNMQRTPKKNSLHRGNSRRSDEQPPLNNNTEHYTTKVTFKTKMAPYQSYSNSR